MNHIQHADSEEEDKIDSSNWIVRENVKLDLSFGEMQAEKKIKNLIIFSDPIDYIFGHGYKVNLNIATSLDNKNYFSRLTRHSSVAFKKVYNIMVMPLH